MASSFVTLNARFKWDFDENEMFDLDTMSPVALEELDPNSVDAAERAAHWLLQHRDCEQPQTSKSRTPKSPAPSAVLEAINSKLESITGKLDRPVNQTEDTSETARMLHRQQLLLQQLSSHLRSIESKLASSRPASEGTVTDESEVFRSVREVLMRLADGFETLKSQQSQLDERSTALSTQGEDIKVLLQRVAECSDTTLSEINSSKGALPLEALDQVAIVVSQKCIAELSKKAEVQQPSPASRVCIAQKRARLDVDEHYQRAFTNESRSYAGPEQVPINTSAVFQQQVPGAAPGQHVSGVAPGQQVPGTYPVQPAVTRGASTPLQRPRPQYAPPQHSYTQIQAVQYPQVAHATSTPQVYATPPQVYATPPQAQVASTPQSVPMQFYHPQGPHHPAASPYPVHAPYTQNSQPQVAALSQQATPQSSPAPTQASVSMASSLPTPEAPLLTSSALQSALLSSGNRPTRPTPKTPPVNGQSDPAKNQPGSTKGKELAFAVQQFNDRIVFVTENGVTWDYRQANMPMLSTGYVYLQKTNNAKGYVPDFSVVPELNQQQIRKFRRRVLLKNVTPEAQVDAPPDFHASLGSLTDRTRSGIYNICHVFEIDEFRYRASLFTGIILKLRGGEVKIQCKGTSDLIMAATIADEDGNLGELRLSSAKNHSPWRAVERVRLIGNFKALGGDTAGNDFHYAFFGKAEIVRTARLDQVVQEEAPNDWQAIHRF